MRLRALAAIAAFAWIASAAGHVRLEVQGQDEFDPALLRIDEGRYLGRVVPDVGLRTETGLEQLRDLAAGQPTILLLGYYRCDTVCPTAIRNLALALHGVESPEHRVAVLSFDANDTLEDLRKVKSDLGSVPASWTFGLLSRDAAAQLTQSIGYRFFFSERDQTYIHPSVLVFLSPAGEVTRYLYGSGPQSNDVGLALTEARGRVQHLNDLVNMARLVCYRYDPARSRYVLHPALIFGGAGFGVLAIAGLAALTYRKGIKGVQS